MNLFGPNLRGVRNKFEELFWPKLKFSSVKFGLKSVFHHLKLIKIKIWTISKAPNPQKSNFCHLRSEKDLEFEANRERLGHFTKC